MHLQDRKFLKSIKVTYKVIGLNQDRLISLIRKHDIALYNVKKLSNREMLVSVNLNQSKNFFAITKEMCYNIKKVRLNGKALPIYALIKNSGLVLGALVLLITAVLANDFVFSVNFSGSGKLYKREVEQYLSSKGIERFSRFSRIDLERLEDEILSASPHLTFVSAQKKGNTLEIYSTLKTDNVQTLGGNKEGIKSSASGRVESIKVYRGTAVVNVGDYVGRGDLLVDGYSLIKEERVQTGALAWITIIESKTFKYRLDKDGQEQAVVLAEQEVFDKEIVSSAVSAEQITEHLYEYDVLIEYRTVIY